MQTKQKASITLNEIFNSYSVPISEEINLLYIDDEPERVKERSSCTFYANLQSKIELSKFFKNPKFVRNPIETTNSKTKNISDSQKEEDLRHKKIKSSQLIKVKGQRIKRRVKKTMIMADDTRSFVKHLLIGTASFGNAKRLEKHSKLTKKKLKCTYKGNHHSPSTVHNTLG